MTNRENNSNRIGNTYVKKEGKVKITSSDSVSICITNGITDVMIRRSTCIKGLQNTVRIDKDHYMIRSTGEVKKYSHSENQSNEISSNRRKSMNKKFSYLRQFINMNFTGEECERHVTLTYGNPTKEMSQTKNDFKKFWKRFVYWYGEMEYIAIFEPHRNGTWHIHVLIKDKTGNKWNLSKKEIEETWKNGFVKITKLNNHKDIGLYFRNLLGQEDDKDKTKKSARLNYYPLNAKIYTSSKGLEKPSLLHTNEMGLKKIVGNRKPSFKQSYSIRICGTDEEVNRVVYITYNDKINPYE